MNTISPTKDDQRGIVSFMVTLIMMIVISLIVLGFAQVSRRNQRETLDRQLSTQAYYAAESGVNDAIKVVNSGAITDLYTNPSYTTDCNALPTALAGLGTSSVLNPSSTANVKYTCLLLNTKLTNLSYTLVGNQKSVAAPLNLNGNLSRLRIEWEASGTQKNPADCGAATSLPRTTAWTCDYAMLRVDLTQSTSLGSNAAQNLSNNTVSFYLRPASSGSSPTAAVSTFSLSSSPTTRARSAAANCDATTGKCVAVLTFSGGASSTQYYMRVGALYNDASKIGISGNVNGASIASFSDAQIAIDSTGKAQDQLRRIAVRLATQSSTVPANALQTNSTLCKTFVVGNGLPAPNASIIGADGLCP